MKCILPSLLLAIQSAYAIPFEAPQRLPEDPLELSSNQCPPILSQDHTVQSRAICSPPEACVNENENGFKHNLFTNDAQCGSGQRCCYTEIACYSPYDGFCLNKDGPPSQCPSGQYADGGCSHVRGAPNVQCCLRARAPQPGEATQPGAGSDSTQGAPVPMIRFGQPLPDKSSLPTDNEQAAQGFGSPTNPELASSPSELNQFLLPGAVLAPPGGPDYTYGWR